VFSVREVSRQEVQDLMKQGVQVVDVLPTEEFQDDHLPGAINLPLGRIETEARRALGPSRPVVVYCWGGRNASRPRAGDVARREVPTCRLDESIGEVRERVRAAGWNACVVVNDERVVLGLLRAEELRRGDEPIERVMRPGPSTFRPHVPIEELAHHMIHHDLPASPVTTSDGRLVGLLRREDAARVALEQIRTQQAEHKAADDIH
jgi:CBS domain-containing protein